MITLIQKYPEQSNPQREKVGQWLPRLQGGGGEWDEVTANGYWVSCWGGKMF